MGRPLRGFLSGQIYHVIGRGNGGQDLFLDEGHFQRFLLIIQGSKARFKFRVFAYCLMTNHFHLLLQQGPASLSVAVHSILNRYSHWFNAKNQRRGHLFGDRFRAIPCRNDAYFVELLRYIHLNPVRAGLASGPAGWAWTGHNEIVRAGRLVDRDLPLSFFGERIDGAVEAYRDFLNVPNDFVPDESVRSGESEEKKLSPEFPAPAEEKPDLDRIVSEVSVRHGVDRDALLGQRRARRLTAARRDFVEFCLKAGLRPGQIRDYLGCSPAYISKVAGLAFVKT